MKNLALPSGGGHGWASSEFETGRILVADKNLDG
jgi:hypothetical protein